MTKRILITGSAGFIGSHAVDHFLENTDWEVIGLDSFRHRGCSTRIEQDPKRYKIFTHDLSAPVSDRLIEKIGPVDFILNLASESHVDRSISDPVPFWENNTKLIVNILEFARKQPALSHFIQCSTDEVFGAAPDGYFHHEWDKIIPSNPYAASKAAQEALVMSYWRTFNLPCVITNCMNLVGPRQDQEKFLPMIISSLLKEKTLSIHGSPGKIGSRMYLHARNLADAWLFILKNTTPTKYEDKWNEVVTLDRYNIVGDEEINNLDLAVRISNIMGKKLKYELVDFHSTRPGHDRRYALDGKKLRALGWNPPMSLDESLVNIINWYTQRPEWL